jgi:hypothetical protein
VSYPLRGFRPHDKELFIPHYVESCAAGGRLFHFISFFMLFINSYSHATRERRMDLPDAGIIGGSTPPSGAKRQRSQEIILF